MGNTIHIVCLDAPSPPDYGGAIDMYYKIKALHETGSEIVLHYFNYNLSRHTKELEKFCKEIHSYKRKNILQTLPLFLPHIVHSRINKDLIRRLNSDDNPILLEGLHCTGIVPYLNKKERIIIRMHNEEAAYYSHLAGAERSVFRKAYFTQESKLLAQYQQGLNKSIKLACLSETDMDIFRVNYGFNDIHFIPCFIPWQLLNAKEGKGEYCLYHGNLSVSENNEAALWLVKNVFCHLAIPLVIAGKGASKKLATMAAAYPHITLVHNPSISEVDSLVQNAQINVLPSMNKTGVKLKLLNALLNGRHCITNPNGVMGSRITNGVTICNTPSEWIAAIETLMQKNFSASDRADRAAILTLYNNEENARKLSALWSHYQ